MYRIFDWTAVRILCGVPGLANHVVASLCTKWATKKPDALRRGPYTPLVNDAVVFGMEASEEEHSNRAVLSVSCCAPFKC